MLAHFPDKDKTLSLYILFPFLSPPSRAVCQCAAARSPLITAGECVFQEVFEYFSLSISHSSWPDMASVRVLGGEQTEKQPQLGISFCFHIQSLRGYALFTEEAKGCSTAWGTARMKRGKDEGRVYISQRCEDNNV